MESLFFYASKLLTFVISPATWLILIPVLAWLAARMRRTRFALSLWILEVSLILLIGFFSVGQWLVKPLEMYRAERPEGVPSPDGIIVLGGAWLSDRSKYWQHWEMNHAAERDMAFVALSRQFPNAKLVFTGGSGRLLSQDVKEATYAEQLYRDLGLEPSRVVFESNSRNTYENALLSKRLVNPQADETWWLITSAYHMPRSVGVFCGLDWPVVAYSVDHFYEGGQSVPYWAFEQHLWELSKVMREWVGLVVYRITGKTSAFFPEEDCS